MYEMLSHEHLMHDSTSTRWVEIFFSTQVWKQNLHFWFSLPFFQVKPINVAEVKAVCGEYLFIGFPRIMFWVYKLLSIPIQQLGLMTAMAHSVQKCYNFNFSFSLSIVFLTGSKMLPDENLMPFWNIRFHWNNWTLVQKSPIWFWN